MKSRTTFYTFVILSMIAFGSVWLIYTLKARPPAQTFPATINRDCAPWDGSAFTMSFHHDPVTTITVSIWQSPSFAFPVTFTFPDDTMRIGTAYSIRELDPFEELTGKVTFWRVEQGTPVEGEFDFITTSGKHFKGKFKAEWGDEIVYCG